MEDKYYGHIHIKLGDYLKEHGISKNKLTQRAELQRTQLNLYCNNKISRLDIAVLARICSVLECKIEDILEFIPADEKSH